MRTVNRRERAARSIATAARWIATHKSARKQVVDLGQAV
jgi:hypothetical protein